MEKLWFPDLSDLGSVLLFWGSFSCASGRLDPWLLPPGLALFLGPRLAGVGRRPCRALPSAFVLAVLFHMC